MAEGNYSLNGRIAGAAPPAAPGIEVEVVRIVTTEPRHFFLCGSRPWGAYWHWSGKSLPCMKPDDCFRCEKAIARKWRAYIHALETVGTAQREVIIELTHSATVALDVGLCMQPHRGCYCKLSKTKGGKHGRFIVEVMPRRIDANTLPSERDPAVILGKLWLMNEKRDGPVLEK